jgi:predicted permease
VTRWLRVWSRRLAGLVGGQRRDREFREELESHLQMHIDDNRRAGMSLEEARRHALIKLGGLEQVKERHRDRRSIPAIESVLKDLQFAVRLMHRDAGFTAVILVTLAIGIGANTVMFSVVNTVLLRPLPYGDPSRVMFVQSVDAVRRSPGAMAAPDFYTYRAQNRTFDYLEAFYSSPLNLTGVADPQRVPTLIVSSGFFSALGVQPSHGRAFVSQDEEWGSHRVAMLTDGLWRQRFGGDPSTVGRRLMLNGEPYVIVGILPPKFSFLTVDAQLYVPMSFEPGDNLNSHNNYFLRGVGRLKADVTREQAVADLNRLSDAIIAQYSVNQGTAMDVVPLRDVLVGNVRQAVLVLLGAVGFVLLISCANLASLLLARAVVRQREIALRLALGATRARLLRQFLIESLLLSAAGGGLGLALAYVSVDAINLISLRVLPRAEDIQVDPGVLLFTLTVAVLTGVLLGLAPAVHSAMADVNEGLKDGTRTASEGGARLRLRGALVVAEVALSLVLLVGAGLMVKSMYQLLNVNSGFDARDVLTMQISLPARKYVDRELERQFSPLAYTRSVSFFDETIARVRSLPGVQAVGAINGLPLMGEIWGKNITLFDRPLPTDLKGLSPIQYRVVAGDYFRALGIRIHSGRAFTERDNRDAPRVAIVNRVLARRDYGEQDPLGKIISVNAPPQLWPKSLVEEARRAGNLPDNYEPDRFTIVGVVDDVHYAALSSAPLPLVYVPFAQGSEGTTEMYLAIRTSGDPLDVAAAVRDEVAQVDRDQPIGTIRTMEDRVSASVAQRRLQMNVLGAFAVVAGLLAAIGIYGVMSYAVTQRSREIGIRLALGAARRQVVGLMLRQGMVMIGTGVVLGLLASLSLTRVIRALLFGVSATDPSVFVTIVVLLSLSAWLAAYLPARRAAQLEPTVTLRNE